MREPRRRPRVAARQIPFPIPVIELHSNSDDNALEDLINGIILPDRYLGACSRTHSLVHAGRRRERVQEGTRRSSSSPACWRGQERTESTSTWPCRPCWRWAVPFVWPVLRTGHPQVYNAGQRGWRACATLLVATAHE